MVLKMYSFEDILGVSEEIKKVKEFARRACKTSSSVFIYGETGTGKEMMAQAIHNESDRSKKPFIAQNCAAIPENMLESIFFGVKKGSFTGAAEAEGILEAADGGTLYLDELNLMELSFQGKLLRVIQEGELRRIGENRTRKIDVRIIASVSEEPEVLIRSNRLRKDLFYRLNVIRIDIPALNDRKEDIPVLVESFIKKHNRKALTDIDGIDDKALELVMKKYYEGNVRELEHLIEGAIILKRKGILEVEDLNMKRNFHMPLRDKLRAAEEKYIREALIICGYNISKASNFLDIPRQTLQYKMNKYNIKCK